MREKLSKLIGEAHSKMSDEYLLNDNIMTYAQQLEFEADHLIANGVTIPKWIPVTERLPEQNEDVLVYTITNDVRKAHCYGDRQWFAEDGVWRWATHWMPLPKPPKDFPDGDANKT